MTNMLQILLSRSLCDDWSNQVQSNIPFFELGEHFENCFNPRHHRPVLLFILLIYSRIRVMDGMQRILIVRKIITVAELPRL